MATCYYNDVNDATSSHVYTYRLMGLRPVPEQYRLFGGKFSAGGHTEGAELRVKGEKNSPAVNFQQTSGRENPLRQNSRLPPALQ